MEHPKKFPIVLMGAILSEFIIYSIFGLVGYVAFGMNIDQLITSNIESEIRIYSTILRIWFHTFNFIFGLSLIVNIFLYNIPTVRIIDTFC